MIEEDEEINEAMDELERISQDKVLRRIAELREKAIRDENSMKYTALKEGREEGMESKRKEVIQKMLKENMEIEIIKKITGATKEEIEEIRKK